MKSLKELKYCHYLKKVKNLHFWIRVTDFHPFFFGIRFHTFGVELIPKRSEMPVLWNECYSKKKENSYSRVQIFHSFSIVIMF